MRFSKVFFFLFLAGCFFGFKADAQVYVTPNVISEKAYVRDGFDFTLTLKNSTQQNVRLYPLVADVLEEEGRVFLRKEEENLLSSWLEVSRQRINLKPEEKIELPLTIRVDSEAEEGSYYSVVVFARGNTEEEARANASRFNYPQVLVNVDVERNVVERLQPLTFYHEKENFFDSSVDFLFNLENIGNTEVAPKGSLVIYKSRQGRELDSLPVNKEDYSIDPGASKVFKENWEAGTSFGQHRAVLMIEYGDEIKRDIYDTVYFWIIPQWFLISVSAGLFLLLVIVLIIIKKRKKRDNPVYQNIITTLDLS